MGLTCHAKSNRTGKPCRQPVVPGKQVCHYHGGAPGSGGQPTHGRYSRAARQLPEVLAFYEEYKTDPDLMEIANEIALLRALVARHLESYGEQAFAGRSLPGFSDLIVKIGSLVGQRHKMLHGEQLTITARDYETLVTRLIDLARSYFGDHERYRSFISELGAMQAPRALTPARP